MATTNEALGIRRPPPPARALSARGILQSESASDSGPALTRLGTLPPPRSELSESPGISRLATLPPPRGEEIPVVARIGTLPAPPSPRADRGAPPSPRVKPSLHAPSPTFPGNPPPVTHQTSQAQSPASQPSIGSAVTAVSRPAAPPAVSSPPPLSHQTSQSQSPAPPVASATSPSHKLALGNAVAPGHPSLAGVAPRAPPKSKGSLPSARGGSPPSESVSAILAVRSNFAASPPVSPKASASASASAVAAPVSTSAPFIPPPPVGFSGHSAAESPDPKQSLKPRPAPPGPPPSKTLHPRPDSNDDEESLDKRERIIREIVTTEDTYVQNLGLLCALYISPLSNAANDERDRVLTKEEMGIIFRKIEDLVPLQAQFLKELKDRLSSWSRHTADSLCVGDLFKRFAPFFKMYTDYVNNHEAAITLLQQIEKKSRFKKFASSPERVEQANGQNLQSFLIMPIQRVPRYKLLLAELLKNTSPSHPDYQTLKDSLEVVDRVAQHINQAVHMRDKQSKIIDIESQFAEPPEFIAHDRIFVHEGELTKKCRKKDVVYQFFLFNNLLAYAAKNAMGKYVLHRKVEVDQAFDYEDYPTAPNPNSFAIKSSTRSFLVYSKTPEEKDLWRQKILECKAKFSTTIQATVEEGSFVAPVWVQDKEVKECKLCQKTFTTFFRRHHCRQCGAVVCSSCSSNRVSLQNTDKTDRVCNECWIRFTAKLGGASLDAAASASASASASAAASAASASASVGTGSLPASNSLSLLPSSQSAEEEPEWIRCLDVTTQREYYYNKGTNVSVWELPPGAKLAR